MPSSKESSSVQRLIAGLSSEWSRPRELPRLFERLELDRPERMTERRWVDLHKELRNHCIEIGDFDGVRLTHRSTRPSINDYIRLRMTPAIGKKGANSDASLPPRDQTSNSSPPESMVDTNSAPIENSGRDQVFLSYSRKDMRWLQRLKTHLTPMIREGLNLWDDNDINPGDLWREEVQAALSRAKVAVLLVTPDFLASEFIHRVELPHFLQAQSQDGLKIFWLAVKPSALKTTLLANYQGLNDPERPLSGLSAPRRDKELVSICARIHAEMQP